MGEDAGPRSKGEGLGGVIRRGPVIGLNNVRTVRYVSRIVTRGEELFLRKRSKNKGTIYLFSHDLSYV